MTYRNPDEARALALAEEERVTREAAELDEKRALRAIRGRPGFLVVRVVAVLGILAGCPVAGALLGGLIGRLTGGPWDMLGGLILGFGVGVVAGFLGAFIAMARWSDSG